MKKRCVAMLLAGGQGSRLGILTHSMAKPAVPFGGKYRIIDFPLSNCSNSGIDVVGVLTQYQPMGLNMYLGTGVSWDLDRINGGVFILPPYVSGKRSQWYKGTANAIYQNIPFIQQYDPDYVLILSGDHIYKMNYDAMLREHIAHNADVTIASLTVPWDEASRFGIINTDSNGSIIEFDEKPENPRSNKASMGIYIFKWDQLYQYLCTDEENPLSSNDFGKDVLPKMLSDGKIMYTYEFNSYWKDVGTIDSLWEANMDLLQSPPTFDLYDENWRIYSRNHAQPPCYLGENAVLQNSMVTEGGEIHGTVEHSVIFAGVYIGKNTYIKDSVIMPGAWIDEGCVIEKAIVSENAIINRNSTIGSGERVSVIGSGVHVSENSVISAGEQVGLD